MKKVKFGVVGVNSRGRGVLGQVIGEQNIELKAVCDIKPEELAKAKDYFENEKGVKDLECYSDYDEMLKNADINAVFVATYAIDHVSFVIKALEAGKHVLSEIPAVNSIEEAKKLKEAVLAHPEVKYMVAENCCYWGFIQAWKVMAEEGKFGEAVYAESEYLHSADYRDLKPENFPPEHWRSFIAAAGNGQLCRMHGPVQITGVDLIERNPFEHFSGSAGILFSLFRQCHIHPTCKGCA